MPWTGSRPIERLRWVYQDSERVLQMGWTNPETGLVGWQNVPEFVDDKTVLKEESTVHRVRILQLVDQIKFMLDELLKEI